VGDVVWHVDFEGRVERTRKVRGRGGGGGEGGGEGEGEGGGGKGENTMGKRGGETMTPGK
jgi:hypothetical protein